MWIAAYIGYFPPSCPLHFPPFNWEFPPSPPFPPHLFPLSGPSLAGNRRTEFGKVQNSHRIPNGFAIHFLCIAYVSPRMDFLCVPIDLLWIRYESPMDPCGFLMDLLSGLQIVWILSIIGRPDDFENM